MMKESKIHDVENGKSDVKEEPGSVARERVKQIFQYLSALQHRKYPTIRRITDQKWSKRFGEFPNHPAIAFGDFAADNQELDDDVPAQESDEDFVVRVGRPNLTTCPAPPEELDAWLEPGWEDPAKEATVIDTINERGDEGTAVATDFDDDPIRLYRSINGKSTGPGGLKQSFRRARRWSCSSHFLHCTVGSTERAKQCN